MPVKLHRDPQLKPQAPRQVSTSNVPEHSNLRNDMIPVSRSLEFIGEDVVQLLAHVDDSESHGFDVLLPLLEQLLVV